MRITVRGLRRWIVVAACLLVVVLAGFIIYARMQFRHLGKDLPGRLGVNIQQTANGFTYSQSEKGHTLFTIHASKLVRFKKGGHAELHNVAITLYGAQGSGRTDKIAGDEFDYDQHSGIATALGQVQIDLAGLGASKSGQAQNSSMHVKTSGLVFNQKTGEAATTNLVEFTTPKASGSAVGASYNSRTGQMVLNSKVAITTDSGGKTAIIHASHAELQRDTQQAYLIAPDTEFQDGKSTAKQAVISFRQNGTAEKIDARGDVHLATPDGGQMNSQEAIILLDDNSQPQRADLSGGVNFVSDQPGQQMNGVANQATLLFKPGSMLRHAQFRNTVSFVEQVTGLAGDAHGTATREVRAAKLDIDFTEGPDHKSLAQKLLATGHAVVVLRTIPSRAGPRSLLHDGKSGEQSTTISADQLLVTLANGNAIQQLEGAGHTKIVRQAADGSANTTSGNTLHLTFTGQRKKGGSSQIDTAVQTGNVALTEIPAQKTGQPLQATAQRAEYDATTQLLRLTGAPRLDNGAIEITAASVDYHRDTGDVTAKGDVKATYQQKTSQQATSFGGQGPMHIVAAEAQLNHSTGNSIFTGSEHTPARMWQGADAVAAPVLELSKAHQMIRAHGEANEKGAVVETTLTSATGPKHQPSVLRIQSRTLLYSGESRRGDFNGAVEAQSSDGTIRSDDAQVFLTRAQSGKKQQQQSQIDHIVASGHVVLSQPGREGTGQKLVYTAADGRYVLTGTAAHPPRIEDAAKGTTTGSALIFNSQNDSVVVSGGQSSAVTETRAPR